MSGRADDHAALQAEIDRLRIQLGGLESRFVADLGPHEITRAEFQVFSQFGEDGIIQFLVQRVPIEDDSFVELGVDDYRESNTRFLLVHDNWRGLAIDAGIEHRRFVRGTGLDWRHRIDAKRAWVDRKNINRLLEDAGFGGDIGLLSVDLDGIDYWVLDAIDAVSPRILVGEYNSVFGREAAVTVPYDARFVRSEKHWSWLYWGASLPALALLADRKGFALVGGTSTGVNAFFVRRDVLGDIPEVSVDAAWRPSRFRASRDRTGKPSYVSTPEESLRLLADMPVVDVEAGRELPIGERFGLEGFPPP